MSTPGIREHIKKGIGWVLTKLRGPHSITNDEAAHVVALDGRGTSLWFYEQCVRMCSSGGYGVSPSSRALDLAMSIHRQLACPTVEDDSELFNNLDDEGMTPAEGDDEAIWVEYLDGLYKILASSKTIKASCTVESIIHAASQAHTNTTARTLMFSPTRDPDDRDSATGRKDAGPCFADSGTSARESTRAEGPREAQPVDGDTDDAQPSAGEKRGATYDVRGGDTSQKQRKLCSKARRRGHGSKLIPNKDAPIQTGRVQNDRTCLVDAVNAHLLESMPNHERESIIASLMSIMPSEGDTTIEAAEGALKKYGLSIKGVNKEFFDGNRAHNILKERGPRKLIIGLRLFDLKEPTLYASHLVAWDGSIIHERPKKLRVNNTTDRLEKNSVDLFKRLYHPTQFSRWQITSVYELHLEDKVP